MGVEMKRLNLQVVVARVNTGALSIIQSHRTSTVCQLSVNCLLTVCQLSLHFALARIELKCKMQVTELQAVVADLKTQLRAAVEGGA